MTTVSSTRRRHPQPKTHVKRAVKHGVHLSKHAARVITVSAIVGGLSFLVVNAALLTMQITSLPLFLRVGNMDLSLHTPNEARVLLGSYGQGQDLELTIGGKNYRVQAEKAGIKLDVSGVMSSIQHPSGWDRVPLFYAFNNLHRSFPLKYQLNDSQLKGYLSEIKLPQAKTTNASLIIPGDISKQPYIKPEKAGYKYTVDALASQINQEISSQNLTVIAEAQTLQPQVSASQLAPVLSRVNLLINRELTITNGEHSYELTAADLRKIVSIGNPSGSPKAVINHKQVVELLRAHSNLFYTPAKSNKVKTLDSKEISRNQGASGRAVNIEASANQIAGALQNGQAQQLLTMTKVSPSTTYLRNYTATSAGLLALIKDFAATHRGTYAVATFELNDNRSAYYNQNVSTVPASTYKLFVAYVALKKIEQGSLSFSSMTSAGDLDTCVHKMIIYSDNTCAQAILDLMGWSETENQVKAAGFSSTNINNTYGGYMSTTANDLAKLLKGFYNGTLLDTSSTSYLFNLMRHQIYRSGIPAGSHGASVADKVGFLNSWNHDAAIVYAPHSTYALVIMTTNASFTQIKDLANQIYNLYNQ